ncbi:hypothetical protein GPECTOR_87g412 [Gonium pectorale]|uniref:Uncharacterized protein n=1 Tax=Gonium pectorale TaxID=33097 RepID=A0A150G2L3_GONPE|nr:hypothetical protein GPECTOR_87g412 [Gonium pectorale]|eukprot:KXZ43550.1 hypothetical protein GPECTOR_87g412 [Gonium pectorale]
MVLTASRPRLAMGLVMWQALNLIERGCGFEYDVEKLTPEQLAPLRPTLGYSFWLGLSRPAKAAMVRAFLALSSMKALVIVDTGSRRREVLELLEAGREGQEEQAGRRLALARVVHGLAAMGGHGTYSAFIVVKAEAQQPH